MVSLPTIVAKGLPTANLISGSITGSRPKKEHSPGSLLGARKHKMAKLHIILKTVGTGAFPNRDDMWKDCCQGALLSYLISRKLQFFILLSLTV